jgi:hypothetical protein
MFNFSGDLLEILTSKSRISNSLDFEINISPKSPITAI